MKNIYFLLKFKNWFLVRYFLFLNDPFFILESGEKIVKCLDGCSDALMDPESGCSVCFKGSYYNTSESRCISCQSQFNN